MTVASVLADARALMASPPEESEPYWHRPCCPFSQPGVFDHRTLKMPTDFEEDRVTWTGWLCLDCGYLFGGGLGLMKVQE